MPAVSQFMQSLPHDPLKCTLPPWQQCHKDFSLIPSTALTTDIAIRFEPINQSDDTMVTKLKTLGQAPNGSLPVIFEGASGQE